MKFLDDLRAYLEWPYRSRPSEQRLAAHRRHPLDRIRQRVHACVFCEESPLGGARFVVRLPVGIKRSA